MLASCFFFLGMLAMVVFSSCDGVIFSTIREEVKLSDAKVSGDISTIVRYQLDGVENAFVSNGEIYNRSIATNVNAAGESVSEFIDSIANSKIDWSDFKNPNGDHVFALAADSNYLYAATIAIEEDDDGKNVGTTRTLWCYSDGEWSALFTAAYSDSTPFTLFCTNSPKSENRTAYFRYVTKVTLSVDGVDKSYTIPVVYELNGTEKLKTIHTTETSTDETLEGGYIYKTSDNYPVGTYSETAPASTDDISNLMTVSACASFGGTVYFTSNYAMITNEDATTDATYIYYSSGDNVYYSTDASTWTAVDLDCDTIYSLGVTLDYLLAGTDSGIVHTKWATETPFVPAAGNNDFSTNADSTLSSYYEVSAILVVDPLQSEYGGTIFATSETSSSSASLNNVGLWSYYASEKEWNRE